MTEDGALDDLLEGVRDRNRSKLLARLTRVRMAVASPPRVIDEGLRADLHALIGALGTFGWTAGSVLIEDVQRALNERDAPGRFLEDIDALVEEVNGTGRPSGG